MHLLPLVATYVHMYMYVMYTYCHNYPVVSTALPQVNTITTNATSEQGAPTKEAVSESQECFEDLSMSLL